MHVKMASHGPFVPYLFGWELLLKAAFSAVVGRMVSVTVALATYVVFLCFVWLVGIAPKGVPTFIFCRNTQQLNA